MTNYKYSLWFTLTLLVVALIVMLGTAASISAHATEILLADEEKIKVRKEEEHSLKKEDKLYSRQAQALVQQYKNTAKLVKSQGGDPQPLLDAVDYFKTQSNIK